MSLVNSGNTVVPGGASSIVPIPAGYVAALLLGFVFLGGLMAAVFIYVILPDACKKEAEHATLVSTVSTSPMQVPTASPYTVVTSPSLVYNRPP
jgi:hypothetical protein